MQIFQNIPQVDGLGSIYCVHLLGSVQMPLFVFGIKIFAMNPESTSSAILMWLRYIHVAVGGAALLLGLLQIVLPHGGALHRSLGRYYVLCMVVSFFTAFPLSLVSGNLFLTIVGLFSLHMAVSGQRVYVAAVRGGYSFFDKILALVFSASAIAMIWLCAYLALRGAWSSTTILGVFAVIFSFMVFSDVRALWGSHQADVRTYWKFRHIGRMVGSYIAAFTAFLVNVEPFGSSMLNWLLPTAVGSAFIWYQIGKHKKGKR